MKKNAYFVMLLGTAVILSASAPVTSALRKAVDVKKPRLAAVIETRLELGDRLTTDMNFELARKEYRAAAELARSVGKLPVEAMRRVANAYYFEGDYSAAAAVLDDLAAEALTAEDFRAGAWALVDAAWIGALASGEAEWSRRVDALSELLASGRLAPNDRSEIEDKVAHAELSVLAPHLSAW